MTAIDRVLAEFRDAWDAGRRPDLLDYVARVPPAEQDELADAIMTWLETAPMPDYDDATRAEIAADPILVAALAAGEDAAQPWPSRLRLFRERAGLAIDDLAAKLTETLGLSGQEQRTAEYLSRAEHDELDERRVSKRLVGGLARALGVDPGSLMPSWPSTRLAPQHFRMEPGQLDEDRLRQQFDALARAAAAPAPDQPLDEVDRLFLGGPEG